MARASLSKKTILGWSGYFLVSVFLAAAQLRILFLVFGEQQLAKHIAAAQGVVDGLPHWRIYQSRLIGPYAIEGVSRLTGWEFHQAYLAVAFALLIVFFLVVMGVARSNHGAPSAAVGAAAAAAFLNAFLMQGAWLYIWDFVDLIVFSLLIWAVVTKRSLWVVAMILGVEMLNREVVFILCGWLGLDALVTLTRDSGSRLRLKLVLRRTQLATAFAMLVLCYVTVEYLTASLLVREIGPEIYPEVVESGSYIHFKLANNLQALGDSFSTALQNLMIVFNLLIFAIPVVAGWSLFSRLEAVRRLGALHLILWGFTFTFGLMYETRVWISFVPFLVLVLPSLMTPQAGNRNPMSTQSA